MLLSTRAPAGRTARLYWGVDGRWKERETEVVRMLSIVAPGGLEVHFQDARFSEPARDLTLPTPSGEPDAAFLEEMGKNLVGYGTELVGPPGPPQEE
jgi:hypothetical protein